MKKIYTVKKKRKIERKKEKKIERKKERKRERKEERKKEERKMLDSMSLFGNSDTGRFLLEPAKMKVKMSTEKKRNKEEKRSNKNVSSFSKHGRVKQR